jgi:hypothetical protein
METRRSLSSRAQKDALFATEQAHHHGCPLVQLTVCSSSGNLSRNAGRSGIQLGGAAGAGAAEVEAAAVADELAAAEASAPADTPFGGGSDDEDDAAAKFAYGLTNVLGPSPPVGAPPNDMAAAAAAAAEEGRQRQGQKAAAKRAQGERASEGTDGQTAQHTTCVLLSLCVLEVTCKGKGQRGEALLCSCLHQFSNPAAAAATTPQHNGGKQSTHTQGARTNSRAAVLPSPHSCALRASSLVRRSHHSRRPPP